MLRYAADVRSLGFTALFFALVAFQWLVSSHWALTPASGLAQAGLWLFTLHMGFVGAVNTHNMVHTPPFRSDALNAAYRLVVTLWYGQPVSLFVPVHNHSHHKHVQSRRDITRTTKVNHSVPLLNLIDGTRWGHAAFQTCQSYFSAQKGRGRPIWRQLQAELAVLLPAYAALLVIDPPRFVAFVLLPHVFGQFAIKAINFLQHDGCDYDATGFNHSRNFTGRWFNWWFLNNGFHTIHHIRPGLHWSVLPEAHAALVAPHIHPALDRDRFLAYLWQAFGPGARRRMYDGSDFRFPEDEGPDLPWFFASEETDSVDAPRRRLRGTLVSA